MPDPVLEEIAQLTQHERVIPYLQQQGRLPDYCITKQKARRMGWNSQSGNLCQVASGKAIGGDRFRNREGQLPEQEHRVWREADLNYHCGPRGGQRLLYSNDGLIYITWDHYKNFIPVESAAWKK